MPLSVTGPFAHKNFRMIDGSACDLRDPTDRNRKDSINSITSIVMNEQYSKQLAQQHQAAIKGTTRSRHSSITSTSTMRSNRYLYRQHTSHIENVNQTSQSSELHGSQMEWNMNLQKYFQLYFGHFAFSTITKYNWSALLHMYRVRFSNLPNQPSAKKNRVIGRNYWSFWKNTNIYKKHTAKK